MIYYLEIWCQSVRIRYPHDIYHPFSQLTHNCAVRSKEETPLPCDLLLLQGAAIVNEAMLSGESTPLLKESIELRPSTEKIDMAGADRNSVLFGGTKVLQANKPESSTSDVPTPPDNGCLALVLKTGFGSSQGQLIRTMIFSTERVSANNLESFLFIAFLLVFAIAASAYVWIKGVENDRKRTKLLLDCVIIITSVVPPELPMELSLAVNGSLVALSKHGEHASLYKHYLFADDNLVQPFSAPSRSAFRLQAELTFAALIRLVHSPARI